MPSFVPEAKSTWRKLFFPTNTFSNKQRPSCASWFKRFKWLYYEEENDKACCFVCIKAIETDNMSRESSSRSTKSDSFVQSGYDNWKKALKKGRDFERREKADYHRETVLRYEIAPSSAIGDICNMTSTVYAAKRLENRKMLLKTLSNLRCKHSIVTVYLCLIMCFFPGRQALPCRDNWVSEKKPEFDSHYHQLMLLRA